MRTKKKFANKTVKSNVLAQYINKVEQPKKKVSTTISHATIKKTNMELSRKVSIGNNYGSMSQATNASSKKS